jgi:hypothetical protein
VILVDKSPANMAFGGTDGCPAYVTLKDHGNLESFLTNLSGKESEMQKNCKTNYLNH